MNGLYALCFKPLTLCTIWQCRCSGRPRLEPLYYRLQAIIIIIFFSQTALAQKPKPIKPILPVEWEHGTIKYNADSITGDRVPDYSYCGYRASEAEIPMINVKAIVPPVKGDATAIIQHAIDAVAKMPLDKNGFRGAVLLSKGTYEVSGQIRISASGIVLRGFGAQGQTVILGKGADRDGVINVLGKNDKIPGKEISITDKYVPVNATAFSVSDAAELKTGDKIMIRRPSAKEWITALGTESFGGGLSALGWKAGDIDLYFDRTVVSVNGNKITIDVPLTTSLDAKYGGGIVAKYNWPGRISNIGIENLTLLSDFDKANPKDEAHRWMAITFNSAEDTWVRQVSFKHFAGSSVWINETAKRITVEDCISTEPVSEIGGQRRNTFFTRGQQTLFQRCFAANGYHDFSTGHGATGPIAFVQCVSERPYSFSGTTGMWASGVLFDVMQVDGNAIRVGNRGQDGRGAGWSGANCFFWNCSAAMIECDKPPTAQNWSYGSWSQFSGKGFWAESNNSLEPRSFYYAQLAQRLHKDVSRQAAILEIGTEASSSPSVEVAQELTREASQPKKQMDAWILLAAKRNPISTQSSGAATIKGTSAGNWTVYPPKSALDMNISDGWLTKNNRVLTGKIQEVPWWTGGVEANDLEQAKQKPAITRFVPGRVGPGLTDDLAQVVDSMKARNIVGLNQHYGLWYERRRDDHERIRRMDGDVWPPFYELPFARSGKDSAWDGLSKYDLTKYNTWYWDRMKQFANLADMNGLVLFHQNYFQHNIIEAGAHYVDFPWRTANNINNTGFIEPVNFAGDKRIFYAEQFYDVSNPVRRKLHQQYIWQCLDNFKNNTSVIQFTGEEFTGPLHFVKFWLQTIDDWEQKNKQKELIGLSTTKDVQDAILNDPRLASVVNIIDIKYWYYQANGTAYAPEGGKNLAPRQWARLLKPKATSFEQVYRAVKEYRTKYPGKAIIYSADGSDKFGWAVLMAGGSFPVLPKETDPQLLRAVAKMQPSKGPDKYVLKGKDGVVVYVTETDNLSLDLSDFNGYLNVRYIDAETGKLRSGKNTITAGKKVQLKAPGGACIVWITR
ncbi:MAG: DUF6298 domain-containing protein [Niabella sp.]